MLLGTEYKSVFANFKEPWSYTPSTWKFFMAWCLLKIRIINGVVFS